MKKKILVLASGMGSNFAAIREHIRKKKLKAEISALISDNPESNSLLLALSFKIDSVCIPFRKEDREGYNRDLLRKIRHYDPDLIVTAGYMRILPDFIVNEYVYRIINIHPSLLPAFPGINSIHKAYSYGSQISGCTTHFVDNTVDGGPIILQSAVKIKNGMSETDLTEVIHKEEHKILPLSVQYFIEDRIQIEGRRITIL